MFKKQRLSTTFRIKSKFLIMVYISYLFSKCTLYYTIIKLLRVLWMYQCCFRLLWIFSDSVYLEYHPPHPSFLNLKPAPDTQSISEFQLFFKTQLRNNITSFAITYSSVLNVLGSYLYCWCYLPPWVQLFVYFVFFPNKSWAMQGWGQCLEKCLAKCLIENGP